MPQTVGPWETHPDAGPVEGRQRYYGPDALGFDALPVNVVFPAVIAGNRFEVECFRTATVYLVVGLGGSSIRVDMGFYDVDNATLLTTGLITVVAAGATGTIDIGAEGGGTLRGRVFRVQDFRLSRTAAGGVDPPATLRCWWRS